MKIIRYLDLHNAIKLAGSEDGKKFFELNGDLFNYEITSREAEVKKLLAPLEPPIFLCIGLNYRKHAEEIKAAIPENPILFVKGPNALQNPDDPIILPTFLRSNEVDYECELAVIIGKKCKNVSEKEALSYVLGYSCANDVSARDWQMKWGGGQWSRGKFFDSFAPIGPCIVTAEEIPNPNNLEISTELNGKIVQSGNTSDMIFSVAKLIAFLSGSVTLYPGTVILTGTPKGVGMSYNPPIWLKEGDQVTINIEKIGSLKNPVVLEKT